VAGQSLINIESWIKGNEGVLFLSACSNQERANGLRGIMGAVWKHYEASESA
jgi:hypothetical protein